LLGFEAIGRDLYAEGFTFGLKQAVGGGLELRQHWPSPDNGIQTIIS